MMTIQAERPVFDATDEAHGVSPRRVPRKIAAIVVVGALIVSGATAGVVLSRHHAHAAQPAVALGHAIHPLPIYRRLQFGVAGAAVAPRTRAWPFSEISGPGHSVVTPAKPLVSLHIQYADVRPISHHWNLELIAPEGRTFNIDDAHGRSFVAVVNGRALELLFVQASADGTNFAIGTSVLTRDQAIIIAKSLTTRVVVSR
jgi:hypothetical protein